MALTFKQRLFVAAYLGESNGNATDAARRAGYGNPDIGRQLLRNITIRAAIDARLDGAALSANEVLARISELATGTLGDFVEVNDDDTWKVSLKKARRLRKLGLIKKLKVTKDGATEIELHDPQSALDKLAKFHALYKEQPPALAGPTGGGMNPEDARRVLGATNTGDGPSDGPE